MPLRDKEARRAYCRAYYLSHGGKGRKRLQRLTREERLARKRARSVEYRRANADKIRAYRARPEVKARQREHDRKWREANTEKVAAYMREYMRKYHRGEVCGRLRLTAEQRRERDRAYRRKFYRANIEYFQIARFMYRQHMVERMMADADFYALARQRRRENYRRRRERAGLKYTPKPSMRIPDWCVRGGVLDSRSQWLVNNLTDSQRAFARELAIQRKEQRERMAR